MTKQYVKMSIEDIIPYENNPRVNDNAVPYVEESIKQVGYIAPVIIDESNEILAGHTRIKALQAQGEKEIDVLKVGGLTEEQKKKYRLLDNKTNEFAGWDWYKLDEELADLDFGGFDFGFPSADDIDINSLYEAFEEKPKEEEEPQPIQCPHCGQWFTPEE